MEQISELIELGDTRVTIIGCQQSEASGLGVMPWLLVATGAHKLFVAHAN